MKVFNIIKKFIKKKRNLRSLKCYSYVITLKLFAMRIQVFPPHDMCMIAKLYIWETLLVPIHTLFLLVLINPHKRFIVFSIEKKKFSSKYINSVYFFKVANLLKKLKIYLKSSILLTQYNLESND